MRTATLIALFLGLSSLPVCATEPGWNIETTRRQYAVINANLQHYSTVERALTGYSTEGGELEAHFYESAPRKVIVHFYGCSFQSETEYYFWNGRLFFVYNVRLDGAGTIAANEPGRKITRRENRYYFSQGRLVRWLPPNGKMAKVDSRAARQQARTLLTNAREWLAITRKSTH